jgi:hypothetical protein
MTDHNSADSRAAQRPILPLLVFALALVLGVSIANDLNGTSLMDMLMIRLGSFTALKIYLWIEGAFFALAVVWIGMHVVRAGFAVTRGVPANMFGIPMRLRPRVLAPTGYIFVVLGAGLVALAIASLAVLNSCRYMQIV